jgi:hypothetical protein
MCESSRDFLYLIWKDPESRRNYTVGKLSRGNPYTFEYCEEYKEAMEAGWELLKAFPEDKKYTSPTLFAAFESRLPDPKRRGIDDILKKYGLDEFDGYELLRKSTGRLPIDTYEFIDPIFPDDVTVMREFYIVGIRHNARCHGVQRSDFPAVSLDDELELRPEPTNEYDSSAVAVFAKQGEMLGYIPRYYSEDISARLARGMTYDCSVIEIDKRRNCENFLKVRLRIPRDS